MKKILYKNVPLMSLLAMFLAWFIISELGVIGSTLIATPIEVYETVKIAFDESAKVQEQFHIHALESIERAIKGWGLSLIIGISLGMLVGSKGIIYKALEPAIEFFRSIPPVLLFPLLLVAFNFDERSYIWTIFIGSFPVVLLSVARASLTISKEKLNILNLYKVDKRIRFIAYFMEILPSIFLGARVSLSISIIIAVVTEMVFTPSSGLAIGSLARDAEMEFNTPLFYTSVITIGIFGYASNLLLRKCEEFVAGKQ